MIFLSVSGRPERALQLARLQRPGIARHVVPAAALLYRQGHVKQAGTTYAFAPSAELLFGQAVSPDSALALRTAAEKGRLVVVLPQAKELPWLQKSTVPAGAKILSNPGQSLLSADATDVVSDTGELKRSWEQGVFTINTPKTQAAMGWIGGKKFGLDDVEIAAATRNATVAVQSLDDRPISASTQILISLGARAVPKSGEELPFYAEPVEGRLTVKAPRGLKLYKRTMPGGELRSIAAPYTDGRYLIELDGLVGTYWLVLRSG